MAEGDGLENRCTLVVPGVRIPLPPFLVGMRTPAMRSIVTGVCRQRRRKANPPPSVSPSPAQRVCGLSERALLKSRLARSFSPLRR